MSLLVFPGESNRFELYEDAGDGYDYKNSGCCKTEIIFNWDNNSSDLVIEPAHGDVSLIPKKREWKIGFRAFSPNAKPAVIVNGNESEFETYFETEENTVYVIVNANITDRIKVTLSAEKLFSEENYNRMVLCKKILSNSRISAYEKSRILTELNNSKTTKYLHRKLYGIEHFYGRLIYALSEILRFKEDLH